MLTIWFIILQFEKEWSHSYFRSWIPGRLQITHLTTILILHNFANTTVIFIDNTILLSYNLGLLPLVSEASGGKFELEMTFTAQVVALIEIDQKMKDLLR